MAERERVAFIWKEVEVNDAKVQTLQQELGIHPQLCKILVSRGVKTYEEAKRFFRPELKDLHDPFALKDMDKAVQRLMLAIESQERILIFGDYDVDGTTAITLMYSFLSQFYEHLTYYVPHREKEGYGISIQGIDYGKKENCTLMIALDCGIKAVEQVEYANSLGIDVIICDHHTPGENLPEAHAILDPLRKDCKYPNKNITGCGIGFKLCQAFALEYGMDEDFVFRFLDLLTVSIGSDIVPIIGENRTLAFYGLKKLNRDPVKGIQRMKEEIGLETDYTISDVVFKIGPRINAAGRLGHASEAVKVLLGESDAMMLHAKNSERQKLDRQITEQALDIIDSTEGEKERLTTVLANPGWHKGVVGIVASRLTEYYHRPTVIFSQSGDNLTGSARSVKDFNIYEPLKECSHLFNSFGGHAFAAGLSMHKNDLNEFRELFEMEVAQRIRPDQLQPELIIDAEILIEESSEKLYRIVRQFAPFGPGNLDPIFRIKRLRDTGKSRIVGDGHLKLEFKDDSGNIMKGIAFKMGYLLQKVRTLEFDLAGHLNENIWRSRSSIEMMVKDIKFA